MYVGGTLCENEHITPYGRQPHLPAPPMIGGGGAYLVYLDVWQRHITALEDDAIREKALNGVDTATRAQTLWQVRWLSTPGPVGCLMPLAAYEAATATPTGTMAARVQPGGSANGPCVVPSTAGYRRLENQLYRVEVHDSGNLGTATFKWSRENGTVVARWESQNVDQITISSAGRDTFLGFGTGDWVELTDDENDLLGQSGTLVRLLSVSDNILTLETATATGTTDMTDFHTRPKVRRWDSPGALQPADSDWFDLEDGVQVRLGSGSFRCGDYWLIPARQNTGDIEWPVDDSSGDPVLCAPAGIEHSYCRLAVATHDGSAWTAIDDCRPLFPPLTELVQMFYVSGDGQEALPDTELDRALQVGVSNGRHPVAGARVRFQRIAGDGVLLPGSDDEESGSASERVVITGPDGIAECRWRLGAPSGPRTHSVEAVLLDAAADPEHLPIRFTARLSLASHVYYDGDPCPVLADAYTVQDAIDTLAGQAAITAWQGDGQKADPGTPLPLPLEVMVASACGPVADALVRFTPAAGGRVGETAADLAAATPGAPAEVTTGPAGVAGVSWQLDPDPDLDCQRLEAELISADDAAIRSPSRFFFTGCHSREQHCLTFLDELRANGVTQPSPDGPFGLEVSVDPANDTGIVYTAGIGYVAGCRFEVPQGALQVPALSIPERLILNDSGQVLFMRKEDMPADWTLLADVYLSIDGSRITRIIDRRLDLTHLDQRVERLAANLARRPADRRAAIPEIAQSLPDLTYRSGRNAVVPVSSGSSRYISGLAFDGYHVWAAVFGSDMAYRVPWDKPGIGDLETIGIGGDPAFDVCFDGAAHVWFTTLRGTVISVNIHTREHHIYETVGMTFWANAISPDRVWITNATNNSITVIDPGRGEILATIAVFDPESGEVLMPYACAYDGRFVWLGCTTQTTSRYSLLRILGQELYPDFEDVSTGINRQEVISSLCFDGARLWIQQGSQLLLRDVAIDDGSFDAVISASDSRWPGRARYFYKGLCDGRRVWLAGIGGDEAYSVSSHGARFGTMQGRVPIPNDSIATAMTFDGSHMWFAGHTSTGPQLIRYLAAGD